MDISELSDIQSESGIIGTLIYHPDFIALSDYLKPNHFYGLENGCIYWAISELFKSGIDVIDAYNISNMLASNNAVNKTMKKFNLPSVQEFVELYKETARHSPEEYKLLAENVTSFAFKRELVKALNRLTSNCYQKDYSLEKLNGLVYSEIDRLTENFITTEEVHTLGDSIDDIWDDIVSRRNRNGTYGIPSKYPSFNKYFTFEQGELVVVQAKYKRGKSILLMNEVVHKLKNGVPTLVVDTEMSTRLYTQRLISHITGVDANRVKSGEYSPEEAQKIQDCIAWLKEQPFVHINDPEMTDERMFALCKMLKHKMGLTFVVYDYMKSNEVSTGDNYNILGAKADFLKNRIASELDMAVLSACQLNRMGEVADSDKINRHLSVGIKWGFKTQETIARDGLECGNAYAKIYVNRNGEQMPDDDEEEYIDFIFDGAKMTIVEAKAHEKHGSGF